jgi:2'-5' RNA ligase
MKHIKLFEEFVNNKLNDMQEEFVIEKSGDSYSYGCVMLYFNFPKMNDIHSKIDEKDLYEEENDRTYGLEDEPHITLLYGLEKEVTPNQVKEILENFTFGPCKLYNASLFENEYDVLKFDVGYPTKSGAFLHKCNKSLRSLPYKNDYPDYHPHMTIGYLKKGMGKKYTKMLKDEEYDLVPTHAVFSQPSGNKVKMKINVKAK